MPFIIVGVIVALIAALFAFCWHLSNRAINIKTLSPEEIMNIDADNDISGLKWYKTLHKEQYRIPSAYGYPLYAEYIPAQGASRGTVIFSHGVTVSHLTSVKYMRLFYEEGYDCLVYDHRRHGGSGGEYTTYGYYEKYDLKAVVDWLEKARGFHGKLGIHGESMGSAILLLYAGMEGSKADFYIADCPYTSVFEQMLYRMKVEYSRLLVPLLYLIDWIISVRAGFRLRDGNCLEAVRRVKQPILFIHGDEDDDVPTEMGKALYDAKPEPKEFYLVPGAGHAQALAMDPGKYRQVVFDFIRHYSPEKSAAGKA